MSDTVAPRRHFHPPHISSLIFIIRLYKSKLKENRRKLRGRDCSIFYKKRLIMNKNLLRRKRRKLGWGGLERPEFSDRVRVIITGISEIQEGQGNVTSNSHELFLLFYMAVAILNQSC